MTCRDLNRCYRIYHDNREKVEWCEMNELNYAEPGGWLMNKRSGSEYWRSGYEFLVLWSMDLRFPVERAFVWRPSTEMVVLLVG